MYKPHRYAWPRAWRVVETQHVAYTRRYVDSGAEHDLLERILDDAKPPLPDGGELHYLLATPWRYRPPGGGSRFRGDWDPGVWYGAERERTALAEKAYWTLHFFRDSPDTPPPKGPIPQTSFFVALRTAKAVDVTLETIGNEAQRFMSPADYAETQTLAGRCRDENAELIRYSSVRDPAHGPALAVLDPTAFARRRPNPNYRTWDFLVDTDTVSAFGQTRTRLEFHFNTDGLPH